MKRPKVHIYRPSSVPLNPQRIDDAFTVRMAQPTTSSGTRTEHLATWAANLKFTDLPEDVIQKTKDFFVDWLGCTIAGRHHPAVSAIAKFASHMGPSKGKSELVDGSLNFTTSPAFASLVNGASSHVVEQDDLHNRSIMHPVSIIEPMEPSTSSIRLAMNLTYIQATVIYPAALAVAQDVGATGEEFIAACVVGYEVGCRVGEFLGKSHYEV